MTAASTLGSYRLVAEVGHGGMADVFLAAVEGPEGSGFTKLAVVKKLRENLAEDPEFIAMLMDEARITARLSHPNVVQLFEVGQDEDEYFLAMEYLDGQPLHRVARRAKERRADFGPEPFFSIVSDMLAGLHHAHELADYDGTPLQIVHRDVTPHNVFVTYDGVVKVVDFGIAKAIGRSTQTQQGIVKGKVRYMSPEQTTGDQVDRRTDIFAAGVILWNAATGLKLWGNADDLQVIRGLRMGDYPTSPREACPDVSKAIDAICRKALAFRREDRYATAAEMRADIEASLGSEGAAVRKKIAPAMNQMFAAERARVRAILDAAGLGSAASVGAFTAAIARQASSQPPAPGDHTELMPGAPPLPVMASGAHSVAAMAVSSSGEQLIPAPARARGRTKTERAVLVAADAVAVVLVIVAAVAAHRASARPAAARVPHGAAEVTPDLTPLARGLQYKVDPSQMQGSRAGTRQGVSRSTARTDGSPAVSASASTAHERAPAPGNKLDNTDPWTR